MKRWERIQRPELLTACALVLAVIWASSLSPYFLNSDNLLQASSSYMEIGILALGLTLVIVAGHIDLSAGAVVALSGTALGKCLNAGLPVGAAIAAAIMVGAACGMVNGLLVTRLRISSLVVTLGTLAVYGGLSQGIIGFDSLGGLPESFVGLDLKPVPGTAVPWPLVVFAGLALVVAFLLHATTFGRALYMIGLNREAVRYAGLRVERYELAVFVASGVLASVAAVLLVSRSAIVVYNLADGFILTAITIVVLGGASIYGGSGTVAGTVIALALVATLQQGMGFANVADQVRLVVTGSLLLFTVSLPGVVSLLRETARRRNVARATFATKAHVPDR